MRHTWTMYACLLLLAVAPLAGCEREPTPEERLERAQDALEEGDVGTAAEEAARAGEDKGEEIYEEIEEYYEQERDD